MCLVFRQLVAHHQCNQKVLIDVSNAPKGLPLSAHLFHFSNIAK